MTDTKLAKDTVYRKVTHAVRLTQEAQYDKALPLFEMYLPLLSSGNDNEMRLLTLASSYCGLCLVKVKHRFAEALECCSISLKRDITNPEHCANTALVYLERDDRRRAVKHLHAGLRLEPDNLRIQRILDEIGSRRRPVIRFFHRDHPLNVVLGKMRASGRRPGHARRRSTHG